MLDLENNNERRRLDKHWNDSQGRRGTRLTCTRSNCISFWLPVCHKLDMEAAVPDSPFSQRDNSFCTTQHVKLSPVGYYETARLFSKTLPEKVDNTVLIGHIGFWKDLVMLLVAYRTIKEDRICRRVARTRLDVFTLFSSVETPWNNTA